MKQLSDYIRLNIVYVARIDAAPALIECSVVTRAVILSLDIALEIPESQNQFSRRQMIGRRIFSYRAMSKFMAESVTQP